MTPAQYKALMARRQQLLNKTSDMSDNELKKNDNLLLNKEDRRVTFANETQRNIIEPNSAKVIENKVLETTQQKIEPPKAIPNNAKQNIPKTIKTEEITNKVASNYEFLLNQQKEIISNLNTKIERLEKQIETQLSRYELKNSKNEEMIVTLNTTINNLSEILRNNFTKTSPPTLDAELQTEKEEIKKNITDPVPDTVPDPVPDTVPDTVPDPVPDPVPDTVPDTVPDPVPDTTSDNTSDNTSETEDKISEQLNVKLETNNEEVNIKLEVKEN